MKHQRSTAAILATAMLSLTSCGKEEEAKPGPVGDPSCQGSTCVPPMGRGSPPGGAGAKGDGGAGGAASTGGIATVRGRVVLLADSSFTTGTSYPGRVDIVVDQATPSTSASWDGTTPFSLPGVPGGLRQFRTTPLNPAGEVLGALVAYRVTVPDYEDVFPVVDGQLLRTVVAALPIPQTLVPGAAHAVITLKNAAGAPLSGLTATASAAGAIGHDLGDGYTGAKTGPRGTVLLVNIGSAASLVVTLTDASGQTATLAVPVLPNVVTFAGAAL